MDTSDIKIEFQSECSENECAKETPSDSELHSFFNILPLELQCKILSYLTMKELCASVAPVCKYWRQLAYQPIFWLKLRFYGGHTDILSITRVLQRAKLLRCITLMFIDSDNINIIVSNLQLCPLLEIIDLSHSNGIRAAHLYTLVQACPNVHSVNLEACGGVDDEVINALTGWKRLRTLILSFCNVITDVGILQLSQLRFLEELKVDGITQSTDSAIVPVLSSINNLTSLSLDGELLTDWSYNSLKYCIQLESLEIEYADLMTDESLKTIQKLNLLKRLKIKQGVQLSAIGFDVLFNSFTLTSLVQINLNGSNRLNDAGVKGLARCCPKLEHLNLSWCWDVTDIGIQEVISCCRLIKHLELQGLVLLMGNCFEDVCVRLPNLSLLDLQQCSQIIDEMLVEIVTKKPELKIFNYYGEIVESD